MGYYWGSTDKDYKRLYEQERRHREDLEWERQREEEEAYQRREEERRRREEQRREEELYWETEADTWDEAIRKNILRLSQELADEDQDERWQMDWLISYRAFGYAEVVLEREQKAARHLQSALRKQINAIYAEMREAQSSQERYALHMKISRKEGQIKFISDRIILRVYAAIKDDGRFDEQLDWFSPMQNPDNDPSDLLQW